jgi:hypothetical protein
MTGKSKTIEQYEMICRAEAPYPLNHLPSSDNTQHKALGIMIGMLIDKGIWR